MDTFSRQEMLLYKKTVLRSRYRQWGMVFLLVFLLPYLAGAFWPDRSAEQQGAGEGRQQRYAEQQGTEEMAGGAGQPGTEEGQQQRYAEQQGTGEMAGGAGQPGTEEMAGGAGQPGAGNMAGGAEQPGTGDMAGGAEQPEAGRQWTVQRQDYGAAGQVYGGLLAGWESRLTVRLESGQRAASGLKTAFTQGFRDLLGLTAVSEMESEDPPVTINMSLEEYLCGALPAVIPAEYEPECLKAQAVLLRTALVGAYRSSIENGEPVICVSADTYLARERLRRMWGTSFAENDRKIREAVRATKGLYLTCQGEPILPCFFRVSAGKTRDGAETLAGEYPYLQSVECPRDYLSAEYISHVEYTAGGLQKILGGVICGADTDSAGYCKSVSLYADGGEQSSAKSAEWVREELGLPSAHFTVEQSGRKIIFTVKGLGHGLGMSQFAANEMAKAGDDFITILSYFFQNIAMDKYE